MWLIWLLGVFLLADPTFAEPGISEKYERDYNIFNPINSVDPGNPTNPINRVNSINPLNPINEVNPNNPLNPINRYNPDTPFEPLR